MRVQRSTAVAIAAAVVVAAVGGYAALNSGAGSKGIGRSPNGGGASSPAPAPVPNDTGGPARAPHSNVAYIYNLFGLVSSDVQALDKLKTDLTDEGYAVTMLVDSTEGAGSRGGATLANFAAMAKDASVIIVNGHGFDFSGTSQSPCPLGRGIAYCAAPDPAVTAIPGHNWGTQPGLQVEWYPTWEAEKAAYRDYVASGFDPNWLIDPPSSVDAPTLIDWREGDLPKGLNFVPDAPGRVAGTRPWLGISAAGIAHFFQNSQLDLVDVLDCHSMSVSTSFAARSYFGHTNEACSGFEQDDEPLLFDRLIGKEGVPARTTTEAMALGGFKDKYFGLAADSKPVVLSPAVESVSPVEGALLTPGTTTPAEVRFDAEMDRSNTSDVVTVSGCGATIKNLDWPDKTRLTFDVAVPTVTPDSTLTVTVHKERARAEPGGFPNQQLDGNSNPPASPSGLAPNRDDYVYRLSCSPGGALLVHYAGTFQADYDEGSYSYRTQFTWDESERFTPSAQQTSWVPTTGQLTATGATTSRDDNCIYVAAKNPQLHIVVNYGGQGTGNARSINVDARMPIDTNTNGQTDNELTFSGTCTTTSSGGINPYLHQNPLGGTYDPGAHLQEAIGGQFYNIPLQQLTTQPFTKQFPVDYTQQDKVGGTEHVVVTATLTITSN